MEKFERPDEKILRDIEKAYEEKLQADEDAADAALRDPDEAYDRAKEEAAFPPQPPEPEKPKTLAMQKITLTFANGRRGYFMGEALMTNDEFRGMKDINLSHVDIGEPFVIKTEEPSPQASSAEETAV